MSSLRGTIEKHRHMKAIQRAKELDGDIENLEVMPLESQLSGAASGKGQVVGLMEAAKFRLEQEEKQREEAKLGEPKVLMKDGKWLVPPKERPVGWERLTLAEPSKIAQNSADSICTPLPERTEP